MIRRVMGSVGRMEQHEVDVEHRLSFMMHPATLEPPWEFIFGKIKVQPSRCACPDVSRMRRTCCCTASERKSPYWLKDSSDQLEICHLGDVKRLV